jgi:selenocysteine lyase/cysteine desulfurase
MISRKKFLHHTALATARLSLFDFMKPAHAEYFKAHLDRISEQHPEETAQDEEFWKFIRSQYSISSSIINLNNGGVSPQPIPVQEAHIRNYKFSNEGPTYFMWRILDQGREPLRARLADMMAVSPDEIAINRNTTEGLNSIIFGMNLKAGDEVVLSKYDYPNMMNAWRQRERRDGIKLNWVDFDFPMENDELIVKKFSDAITPRTKVVHVTHIINWTGQILPVRKIADMAHEKGCEVIADIAHSFAHLDFKIADLNCDYAATSLHKWLCAPFGTGLMYIKKEKIKNIWALLSSYDYQDNDIRKFEVLGTRSFAAEMAISNAIDFQLLIGTKRKEARLRFLKNYWCDKVKQLPKVKLFTSLKPEYSGALATFSIEGMDCADIESKLLSKYKIHTTIVKHEKLNCVRVTPHVYTSLYELDELVEAITALINNN